MSAVVAPLRSAFEHVESAFDAILGATANPLRMLGALAWFFFWVVVISGIYLYIFFDSGIEQAYQSVDHLTHAQWYAGGVMRSLHRYASDALVVVVLAHLVREFAFGRYGAGRWFTWFSGVPLVWLMFAAGITGYWVVWDRLAQYVAIATTEWLDVLPLFGEAIARNFLHSDALSGRFFTLMVFIHLAVPLVMLFLMWIHVQRLGQPRVNPPRTVALGLLGALFLAAFTKPAVSQGPANLDTVVTEIGLDWFYLGAYPLLDRYPGEWLWLAALFVTLALLAVPWLLPHSKRGVAVVNLGNCNGCSRCFNDCPFGAIAMTPRSDGEPFALEATVNPDRCVDCGICVGTCPTATPFRRRSAFTPGIDLAARPLETVRQAVLDAGMPPPGETRVMTFACEHGPGLTDDVSGHPVVTLNCIGMLPPSFIDFVLSRGYADGVMLAGCSADACYHRLGIRWTEARLARTRDPWLRQRVPAARVRTCWAGSAGKKRFAADLDAFRGDLATTRQEHFDAVRN